MSGIRGSARSSIGAALAVAVALAFAVATAAPARTTVLDSPRADSNAATDGAAGRSGARFLLVHVEHAMAITARPGGGRVLGTMPAGSRFYATPTVAWVRRVSEDGRFGLVDVPYSATRTSGWMSLVGLERSWTRIRVVADLSAHRIAVRRGETVQFRAPAAIGAPASPTPTGRYFVTDRVPFAPGGVLGTFAFGLSGIQPRLPPGWSGGDQLAIHGTNDPASIGRSVSAGCFRVSERVLERLRPLLRLGTPVIVRA